MAAELIRTEMGEQGVVLARLCARFEADRAAVAAIAPRELIGVSFVARGSSDNAALLGRYLAELCSGRPASLAAPSLYTRYHAEVDYRGQLVVALSQSGETPEIVACAEWLRERGARVVAITNDASSSLAAAADLTLELAAGTERAIPATKTVTAQMLLVCAVAAALGPVPFGADDLARLPREVDSILTDSSGAARLAQRWADEDRFLCVSRGLLLSSALETGLKVRETAAVFAQGISTGDLLHGPIASVVPALPVLLFDGGGPTSTDVWGVAARLRELGADVAWCSSSARAELALPAGLPEALLAIAATVRGQQLALAAALTRGLDPDRPAGLAKVTRTS